MGFSSKPVPKEGTHAHDVMVVSKLLKEARDTGFLRIENTVDGTITIVYEKGKRFYKYYQEVDGQIVSHVDVLRRYLQDYLIELRERRRELDKEQKKQKKGGK